MEQTCEEIQRESHRRQVLLAMAIVMFEMIAFRCAETVPQRGSRRSATDSHRKRRMEAVLQQLVWQRARYCREYCHIPAEIALLPFQLDHIIAEKHGGPTTAENLALSCERCDSHKGPNIAGYLEGNHVPLFHPRQDRWVDPFAWNGPVLVGKTPVGIVTIAVLAINLPYRFTLRTALIEEGIFPPEAE